MEKTSGAASPLSASSDEEEEEELYEPKFKYKRILNDVSKIFSQDAASCFAVHEKFIVLGTQWGRIYVLDPLGNILPNKVIVAHTVAVNQISIDALGECLVSCSNDGKVGIYGLASAEHNQVICMDRPIRSVEIDPEFAKRGSGQQFVTGDRSLVLHQRGIFSRDKQQVIFYGHERDGFIHAISWHGPYIAFANDTGVRLYDRLLRTLITHVKREHDLSMRAELYPAHICWPDERSFAIAWADTLTVCAIRENPAHLSSPDLPGKLAEIRHLWTLPSHYVAGVSAASAAAAAAPAAGAVASPSAADELVLFCVCKRPDVDADESAESAEEALPDKPTYPRVWLIEAVSFQEFDIVTEDIIEMRDSDKLMCHNYHMASVGADNVHLLLSNRDMIEVRPCSADDHVEWLLKNGLFRKALEFTRASDDSLALSAVAVGRQFLDHLLGDGHFDEAAALCPEVCGRKKDVWEEYVTRFESHGQLRALAPLLPTQQPQLEPECYEMVLLEFLRDDVAGFQRLIRGWKPELYRVGGLIQQTLEKLYRKNLDRDTHNKLLRTLGTLYTYERKYERALAIYMNLGDSSVFELIDQFQLFPQVKDRIRELMDIHPDLAVRLLLENEDRLPAATVMRQLTKQPVLQLAYLDRLFARNEGAEFADLAVQLYAEHKPDRLLPFLRRSESYRMDRALEICKQRKRAHEVVFLLGRGGNRREALRVIIAEQRDIYGAIVFCKEHDDVDLWNDLIQFGVQRPEFITILMQNIGTHVDPTLLIGRLPAGMRIPGLRDSLAKVLRDYGLQISLQGGCRRATLDDCFGAVRRLARRRAAAVRVDERQRCAVAVCQAPLVRPDARFAAEIVFFTCCAHAFHRHCFDKAVDGVALAPNEERECPLCKSRRRGFTVA